MEHWHAEVSANGYLTDRRKCFTDGNPLAGATNWLAGQIKEDRGWFGDVSLEIDAKFDQAETECHAYDGKETEAWEAEIPIPDSSVKGGLTMGYRVMPIDGDCEETI